MAERPRGRPRQRPALPPTAPITAPGVEPVITVAQLTALGERLGYSNQSTFAEALGITQGYLSHLLGGRHQLIHGPLLLLLIEQLRRHRLL
jgi:hypothetical protein